ncbi:MAG TPA: O-antigen ligase family protein [Flavobacterium sp.]|nr:O-antigen ligase family protein [Flavobacterium sp.]
MSQKHQFYLFLIALHLGIGFGIYLLPVLSKLYAILMFMGGLMWIFKNRNANHEALMASAYIIGSEVFLRMTSGNPIYEFSKYSVIIFILMGFYFRGFSKNALPYWIYMLCLLPGVIITVYELDYGTDILKTLSFNMSGPICLGISAFYTYRRPLTLAQLNQILLFAGLPALACATYLFFYTPDIRDSVTGTGSNFAMSGGFGPNQVATILGFGMFVFISRVFFESPSRLIFIVNLGVALLIGYRGLITFSRGGMITAVLMLIVLSVVTFYRVNADGKKKFTSLVVALAIGSIGVWTYSSFQTGGLIEKRYANQDAAGRTKKSHFTGREEISATEIGYFLDNPVFGVGAGRGAQIRKEEQGTTVLSHSEITRMLGEHGVFGIFGLIILLVTPLFLYLDNRDNLFLVCFVVFWLATINHAAMRTAAPAFIYSLSLLKISMREERPLHRKQTLGGG